MIKIKRRREISLTGSKTGSPFYFILNVIRHFKRECRRGVPDMMPSRFAILLDFIPHLYLLYKYNSLYVCCYTLCYRDTIEMSRKYPTKETRFYFSKKCLFVSWKLWLKSLFTIRLAHNNNLMA